MRNISKISGHTVYQPALSILHAAGQNLAQKLKISRVPKQWQFWARKITVQPPSLWRGGD